MAKYIVHKAVELRKVKKKLQRDMTYYAQHYSAQPKLDGCCAVLHLPVDGDPYFLSRTGEAVPSMQDEAALIAEELRPDIEALGGIVLIGEAWNPCLPQNVISGLFRQHGLTDKLLFIAFDCLLADEFAAGHSDEPYQYRYQRLTGERHGKTMIYTHAPGTYGTVEEIMAPYLAAGGHDGIILRDPNGTWTAGSGTTGEIIKVKQNISLDLEVAGIGMDTGAKTGRTVYTLIVKYGDRTLTIGSGVPHDFDAVPKVGQIVEIEAMAYSANGLLREPRYKGVRHDKLAPDAIAA